MLLPLVSLRLRLFGLRAEQIGRQPPPSPQLGRTPREATALARRAARSVRRAAHFGPWPGNCLSQSLTLWTLLRRQGIQADLFVGVRFAGDPLNAHAWVEHDGVALNERPGVRERYTAFERPVLTTPGGPVGSGA
jgi:hypothetical protein